MSLEKSQLAGLVAALSIGVFVFASAGRAQAPATLQRAEDRSIRPFAVQISEAELDDLRRRIAATHWADRETVPDDRKASSCKSYKSWFAIGARTTTGARWNRSSMPCRNS